VSKAVEDMCAVIPEIVDASFSTQRYAEALDCMKELREVALKVCHVSRVSAVSLLISSQEDEIDAWNKWVEHLVCWHESTNHFTAVSFAT
jgi:hypothetical protein